MSNLTENFYDVSGNHLRVWRDVDGNIVFVVDETINENKPNVLLVVRPDGERKWDDILVNDFDMDLENVRPKKDNKYQKLDIEYDGLNIYETLINALVGGKSTEAELNDLSDFQYVAARRSATARLAGARQELEVSADTIAKTNESIAELTGVQRELRSKLSEQRKNIGREPTKESASKILKTESKLEEINGKIKRAKRRLAKATRRNNAAKKQCELLQNFLKKTKQTNARNEDIIFVPYVPENTPQKNDNKTTTTEKKDMPDDEVKPLMDQDPEILDEDIAFRPVEFDEIQSEKKEDVVEDDTFEKDDKDEVKLDDALQNISETESETVVQEETLNIRPIQVDELENKSSNVQDTAPVLDTITSVDAPIAADTDTTGQIDNGQYNETPVARPVPVMPSVTPVAPVARPVSPISGTAKPVDGGMPQKNTRMYYLLLIVLIILSVFTLWLYQKKNGETVPDLKTTADTVSTESDADTLSGPFIDLSEKTEPVSVDSEPVVEPVPEPEPVVEPEPIPEPEPIVEPEPVVEPIIEPEPIAEPEPVIEEPEVIEDLTPNIPVVAPQPQVESEADILARKQAYGAYSHDVVFDDDVGGPNVNMPQDVYYQDYGNNAPYYEPQYAPEPQYVPAPQYAPAPQPTENLGAHDGGQYMVVYE